MRVKPSGFRHLYVLVIFAPGSRTQVAARRESRRPIAPPAAGDVLRASRRTLAVHAIAERVEHHPDRIEHIVDVFTRALPRRRPRRVPNVVAMPAGDDLVVAQFIRYHVLVRVFDGDADAWLAQLRAQGDGDAASDVRFVHWIRSRLRRDPALLLSIRRMVDATPFWRAADA
jgi:hypothetical protein